LAKLYIGLDTVNVFSLVQFKQVIMKRFLDSWNFDSHPCES